MNVPTYGRREHRKTLSVNRTILWDWTFLRTEATATHKRRSIFNGHRRTVQIDLAAFLHMFLVSGFSRTISWDWFWRARSLNDIAP